MDVIYDTCPGLRQDSLLPELVADDTIVDPIWGPYRQIDSGRVSLIPHATPSDQDKTHGEAHLSRTIEDVQAGTGSIYGPAAPLSHILSLPEQGEPFAFVGKPCDISDLRNYADHHPRVNELVRYWLTPVCGGIVPPPQMDGFLDSRGMTRQDLESFAYRGVGCPGDTQFTTKDRQGFTANMYEPFGVFAGADIAAGDQWVDDVPGWEFARIDKGTNAVILRTLAGEELWNTAVEAGYLNVEQTITPRFYDTCQHHHVVKKHFTRARCNGVAEAGSLMPRSRELRLEDFFDQNTDEVNQAQSTAAAGRARDACEEL